MLYPSLVPLFDKGYTESDFALDCYCVDLLSCIDIDSFSCILKQAVFDSDLSDLDYKRFYRLSVRYTTDVLGMDPFVIFPLEIRSQFVRLRNAR